MVDESTPTPTPGDAILRELKKRGWTHEDLAEVMGKHRPMVTSLISGKRGITPEIAVALAGSLGQSAEYWMALEASRQLSLIPQENSEVIERAKLLSFAPVKELERRGWIRATDGIADLESELKRFYGVETLDEEPAITFAARKANPETPVDKIQRAWAARAKQMASAMVARPYDPNRSGELIAKLRRLAAYPKESAYAGDVLNEYGIRLVIVEPLDKSRIDGAAFWLDGMLPAIALSLRTDRIDGFWFTLMHEVMHIVHGDMASIDLEMTGKNATPSRMKIEIERRADESAADALIPVNELNAFINMFSPLYSKTRIVQFAHKVKIHPGIIVGQLQHRCEVGWGAHRDTLVGVRDIVTATTLTDGWGKSISPETLND